MSDLFSQLTSGWGEAWNELVATGASALQDTGVELMDWATGRGSSAEVNQALQTTRETTTAIRDAGGAQNYFEQGTMGELEPELAERFSNAGGLPAPDLELTPIGRSLTETLHELPEMDGLHGTGLTLGEIRDVLIKERDKVKWTDAFQADPDMAAADEWATQEFGGGEYIEMQTMGDDPEIMLGGRRPTPGGDVELTEFKTAKALVKEIKAENPGMGSKMALKEARAVLKAREAVVPTPGETPGETVAVLTQKASLQPAYERFKATGMTNREAMQAARGEAQGMERQSVTLSRQADALESQGVELTDLSGTNTSPVENVLFRNLQENAPAVVEALEEKTFELPAGQRAVTDLPTPGATDWSKVTPFEMEDPEIPQAEQVDALQEFGSSKKGYSRVPVQEPLEPEAYKGPLGKLNKGDWAPAKYEGRLTGELELMDAAGEDVPLLEQPMLAGGLELLDGMEEAAMFAEEAFGGSLIAPGIGIGLYIIQKLWENQRDAETERFQEEGWRKHFFEMDPDDTWVSLQRGDLGYCCKFWEYNPWDENNSATYRWGDQNVWLPIYVNDKYDTAWQVTVTLPDGTFHDAVCWFWDIIWLKSFDLTNEQWAKFVPMVALHGRMVSIQPNTLMSHVVDLGYMTRNMAELNLELNHMGDVWFRADGCGQIPGPDLALANIPGAPNVITESIGVTGLWRKETRATGVAGLGQSPKSCSGLE